MSASATCTARNFFQVYAQANNNLVDFVHPSYAKSASVNDIIERIYTYHVYDVKSHQVRL